MAVFGGIMSASMALAFTAGKPIADGGRQGRHGGGLQEHADLLVLALAGGFTTNFISTMILTAKNKAFGDYVVRPRSTLLLNYFLAIDQRTDVVRTMFFASARARRRWATTASPVGASSWPPIIIFSNFWGLVLKEWKLVDRRTRVYLWLGILVLIVSVIMIGVGDGLARGSSGRRHRDDPAKPTLIARAPTAGI